jgi:hypothetical protein
MAGDEHRQRGLSGPGWAPKNERWDLALREGDAEDLAFAQEVGLAHELLKGPGSHPIGQRRGLLGRLKGGFSGKQVKRHDLRPHPRYARIGLVHSAEMTKSQFPMTNYGRSDPESLDDSFLVPAAFGHWKLVIGH